MKTPPLPRQADSTIPPMLIFQHGWAFNASYWAPLRAALSDWPQRTLERGYFGDDGSGDGGAKDSLTAAAALTDAFPRDLPGPLVWIGHSFGFMHGLAYIDAGGQLDGLISINGFPRFSAAPDFLHGTPVRVVERMAAKLRTHTGPVVDDFRQRCGAQARGATQPIPRLDPLLTDLLALRDEDYRATLLGFDNPLLVLASRDDPIVPAPMTQAAFADRSIVWRHSRAGDADVSGGAEAAALSGHVAQDSAAGLDGGHLLPSNATDWCAQQIGAFLRRHWP